MLTVINIDEAQRWDCIVKSFKNHDVFYLSGYAKAYQVYGDGEPLLFYYDDGTTRAINVMMKRDIAKIEYFKNKLELNKWYDLSTPYGYGGFIVEGDNFKAVNLAYDEYCRTNGFVCEFVRFHLFNEYQKYYNGESESRTFNVVRTLDLTLDEIWRDFHYSVRKNMKRAAKSGLTIEIDNNGQRLKDFIDIYYSTMKRRDAYDYYYFTYDFFKTINKMVDNFSYFHVFYEGKVISSELVLYGNENCYFFLGGTNSEYFHLHPNEFLISEIIKWGKDKGLKRFVLGGGYGQNDGIYQFKKNFAPNGIYNFYIGKKIFDIEKYEKLVNLMEPDVNIDPNYFPKYRAAIRKKRIENTKGVSVPE